MCGFERFDRIRRHNRTIRVYHDGVENADGSCQERVSEFVRSFVIDTSRLITLVVSSTGEIGHYIYNMRKGGFVSLYMVDVGIRVTYA